MAVPGRGLLRTSDGWHQAGWQALAIGCGVLIACSTTLPTGLNRGFFVFDLHAFVTPRLVGKLAAAGAFAGGLALAALAWRRRHIWMARLSLPLIGYAALCGIGLAMLVLISQPPRYLARIGLEPLHRLAQDFDDGHMIAYFGFAIVAAIPWRRRVSLPVLGVLLMAYGCGLELAQHLVPTRAFRIEDLVSNGWGILLGMCWVYLYDSLFGAGGTGLSRRGGWRNRRSRASGPGTGASVQPRQS